MSSVMRRDKMIHKDIYSPTKKALNYIKVNKIKCLKCNTILESKSRHDFQICSCPNQAFTDGGHDYQRYGARDITQIELWDDLNLKWKKA